MNEKYFYYRGNGISGHHTRNDYTENAEIELHAHRHYELFCFISGKGLYTIEGNEYPLKPGCLLVLRDGEAHTAHIESSEPYERISINFTVETMPLIENQIRELYCNRPLGKGNYYLPTEESAAFINSCIERICNSAGTEKEGYEDSARIFLSAILLELYKIREERLKLEANNPESNVPEMKGRAETVRKIIGYINENLTTIKNSDELEREFFFSKAYINRIFKQATGSSVWDYIVLKRLLLARTMLKEGKQAGIVASECGFCDYSSFYRQYRRRFGISPQAARKKG